MTHKSIVRHPGPNYIVLGRSMTPEKNSAVVSNSA